MYAVRANYSGIGVETLQLIVGVIQGCPVIDKRQISPTSEIPHYWAYIIFNSRYQLGIRLGQVGITSNSPIPRMSFRPKYNIALNCAVWS